MQASQLPDPDVMATSNYKRLGARPAFSICRAIAEMASPVGIDSDAVSPEIHDLTATGPGFSGHALRIPFTELTRRDLSTLTAGAGGALVASPRAGHANSMVGFGVVADAGATVIMAPEGTSPSIPVISAAPVAGFVAAEGDAVPTSDAVFALRPATTRTAGVSCAVSRKFLIQGGQAADDLVRRELLQAVGRAIDKAVLQGNGSNEPQGLAGLAGVTAQAGASLAWAGLVAMQRAVADAGARDDKIRWIGTPSVRELLQKREKAAGSGLIWADGRIDGAPASVSTECPAGTLFVGDWSVVQVLLHGGITLMVDPRVSPSGSARLVVLVDVAVEVLHPAVFARATSIS